MSLPDKIYAITYSKPGDLDVIEKTELSFPTPEPTEILVKFLYGGINMRDTYLRNGLYPVSHYPFVLGCESSGVIVSLPSDPDTLNNEEFKKRGFVVGGKVAVYVSESFSEYRTAPWKSVFPIPDEMSLLTAAACLTQGLTALSFVTEAYNVQKGDYIFVSTVAGGLGLALAQLCKARGAIVIGTTSTPKKAAIAREHGADHIILYPVENTVERVLEITNGQGVHAAFDGVGKDTFEDTLKFLRRKGTFLSVGNTSGAVPPFSPLKLAEKNLAILRPSLNVYIAEPEDGRRYSTELFKLVVDGSLKIQIFKEYPFTAEGSKESHRDLQSGKSIGKLVLKIAD